VLLPRRGGVRGGVRCVPRCLDGVTSPGYARGQGPFPYGPLEVAHVGIPQARDTGSAPRPSRGRLVLRSSHPLLPGVPSSAAAGHGRCGADGRARRRRGCTVRGAGASPEGSEAPVRAFQPCLHVRVRDGAGAASEGLSEAPDRVSHTGRVARVTQVFERCAAGSGHRGAPPVGGRRVPSAAFRAGCPRGR